jgi:hypothetical protein
MEGGVQMKRNWKLKRKNFVGAIPTDTTMTDEKMKEYGYYEVFVPVWNPNNDDLPPNLVIDVYGDEETLDEIGVGSAIRNYAKPGYNTDLQEQTIQENIGVLIDRGLVMDMMCKEFDINSVEDFQKQIQTDSFDLFPL